MKRFLLPFLVAVTLLTACSSVAATTPTATPMQFPTLFPSQTPTILPTSTPMTSPTPENRETSVMKGESSTFYNKYTNMTVKVEMVSYNLVGPLATIAEQVAMVYSTINPEGVEITAQNYEHGVGYVEDNFPGLTANFMDGHITIRFDWHWEVVP